MEKIARQDIPYGVPRIRKDFADLFTKLLPMLEDREQTEVIERDTETEYRFRNRILPFEVRFFENCGILGGGMVYFEGEGWSYKLAYVKPNALAVAVPIVTHKGMSGDMDRMVEDLISGKLTL